MPESIRYRRSARQSLHKLLRKVRHRTRATVPKRVVGRGRDGVEEHLRLDGTCPTRAGIDSHTNGQVVLGSAEPISLRGSLGLGTAAKLSGGAVRILEHEPRTLARGTTQEVTLRGVGLSPELRWQYLRPPSFEEAEALNEDLVIEAVEPVSSAEHRLTVSVAPGAALVEDGPMAFGTEADPQTILPGRAEDLYAVVEPEPRYLAFWSTVAGDELAWLGAWLDPEGGVQSWLGPGLRDVALDYDIQARRCAPIVHDATGRVSSGSLLQPDHDRLVVVDLAAGVRHLSPVLDDEVVLGAASHDGEIFALLHGGNGSASTHLARVVTLPADLSSISTVNEVVLAPEEATALAVWSDYECTVALGRDAAYLALEWADLTLGVPYFQAARLPYDGAEPEQRTLEPDALRPLYSVGLPYAPGGAVRGSWIWEGGLGSGPGDPAWRRWTSSSWGEEGGPGEAGGRVVTWDGAVLREADTSNGSPFSSRVLTDFVHPELGAVGRPTLVFPAF